MSDALASAADSDVELGDAAPAQAIDERLLSQQEIDKIAGWNPAAPVSHIAGIRAILDGGASPREHFPMFAVAFDGLVARLSGTFRDLFGGDVGVSLGGMVPVRYGDFIEGLVLPAHIVTFTAQGWDGDGLLAVGPAFAQLALDALLGAPVGQSTGRVAARAFSAIEAAILTRLVDMTLKDADAAFAEAAPVSFRRDRIESDPRLANIARLGDAALSVSLTVSIEGRSADLTLLLPYAILEPVRARLAQDYFGVKLGQDEYWSNHLATELWQAPIEAEAVLHETRMPLGRVLDLAIGDTLTFDMTPQDLVEIRSGGQPLTWGRIGRVDGKIAVQITEPLRRPRASLPAMVGP